MENILIVVNDMIIPNKGGGAPRVFAVARSFKRKGYNPIVLCPLGVSEEEAYKQTGIHFVAMKFINRADPQKFLKYALYNPVVFFKVIYLSYKYRVKLILAHNAIYGFSSIVAGKILNIPTIFDPTDFFWAYLKEQKNNNFFRRNIFSLICYLEQWTIKNADKTISNTRYIQDFIYKKFHKSIEYVYDGVDFKVFYPSREREKDSNFYAILQGGMDLQDGLEIVVPCVEKVIKEVLNFKIFIVGDGRYLPILKKEVKDKKLEKYFYFTGWVSQDQVRQYMSDSDVGLVILPNRLSGKIRITLRLFEFWACNLPVIATDLDSIKEVVVDKKNGLLYSVEDSSDLANKIIELHKNKKLYKLIKDEGFKSSKKFNDDILADEIVNLCLKQFF